MTDSISRIEDAITRLTNIQSDLSKMLAVHEQRLNHQEKQVGNLEEVMEKRREESDLKLKDVYDTIRKEDRNILDEISKLREEAAEQHKILSERMSEMEKRLWLYVGGISVIVFVLAYGPNILKVFEILSAASK